MLIIKCFSYFSIMNHDGQFLVYKSSAGSGKTYTLVKEYLTIALKGNNHERFKNILAITFTNKAASEMKDRVTLYLKSFCNPKDIQGGELLMFDHLKEELGISKATLAERSFKMLQSILHNYSDFNITTIDKFILKIIRSFSFDLQLPYNFEVELDSDALLNQAINNLLAETGKNKKLTAFLVNYIKQLAQNDESWNLQNSLLKIAKLSLNEESYPHLNELKKLELDDFVRIKESIGKEIRTYEEFIKSKTLLGKESLTKSGITTDQLKGKSRTNIWAYFNKKIDQKSFEETAAPTYFKNIENEEWCSKGNEGSFPVEIQQNLLHLFLEIEQYKDKNVGDYILKSNVYKNLFQLGLMNELDKQIAIIREEQNFIHISEFNKKVAEVVVEQPIPFIYERIGEKFNNYLIDEFQDTSILQWQNLLPLIENSLAYDEKNLIVGDAKQAIYRWRGGDVDQFALLPEAPQFAGNEIIQERIETLKRQFNLKNLDSNYRSYNDIINFNNLFFTQIIEKLPDFFSPYYAEFKQKLGRDKAGGYAEIKILESSDYYESTLNEIFQNIQDCLSRGAALADISILTKKNKDLTQIAEFLTLNNIPVISNESLNLSQSEDVKFIVNLFTCIFDNQNKEAVIQASKYINNQIKIDYFKLFKKDHSSFETLALIINNQLGIQIPGIQGLSLYESFEEIIIAFKISKEDPFIQTFLDIVKDQTTRLNTSEFIEFWQEKQNSLKIASPQNVDAVTLMTIHKSKGLEFPIVMLPFANAAPNRESWLWLSTEKEDFGVPSSLTKNSQKIQKTKFSEQSESENLKRILDELNVTYVALTRAEKELFITIADQKKPNEINGVETFFHQVLPHLKEQENKRFSFGDKTNYPNKKSKVKTAKIKELTQGNWRNKIKISFSAPAIWNVPENSEEAFNIADPRKFGNLIHACFARLKTTDELDSVIEIFVETGHIEKSESETIKTIILNTLQVEPLKSIWNNGKHIIEKEIITKEGENYRPDRIINFEEINYLIDFKTGEPSKKDHIQIKNYATLLTALGFENISAYLLYTNSSSAVKID